MTYSKLKMLCAACLIAGSFSFLIMPVSVLAKGKPILQAPTNPEGLKKKEVHLYTVKGAVFAQAQNAVEELPEYVDDSETSDQISLYTVRAGDTIRQIAKMYGVSVNTILWANDMKKGTPLTKGEVLAILPVSGVKYIVKKGDTIASIAKKFEGDENEIIDYNEIDKEKQLALGGEIIIPGGKIQDSPTNKPPKQYPNADVASFARPVSGVITQGLHDKYAIDIGAPTGTPVHASESGIVVLARRGWNGGYGNYIIIRHPSSVTGRGEVQTVYAHLSQIDVSTGESVSKGNIIGRVGSTGHSTGPHLHFEMRGMDNILRGLPKGTRISI